MGAMEGTRRVERKQGIRMLAWGVGLNGISYTSSEAVGVMEGIGFEVSQTRFIPTPITQKLSILGQATSSL